MAKFLVHRPPEELVVVSAILGVGTNADSIAGSVTASVKALSQTDLERVRGEPECRPGRA